MKLETFLKHNDIGISEFAKRSNMKQPYMSLIVNKKRKPSAETALKISNATGGAVTVMELLFPDQT